MQPKTKIPETTMSESVRKMLAFAKVLATKPVPVRDGRSVSAFDHELVRPSGTIANSSDRVRLCVPEKPCAMCRQRIQLGLISA